MQNETIKHINGYSKDAYMYYPVIIIGAGLSGIAMACQLKQQLGFDQFRIFDRQAGIGGTWWINRYPGVACDIPAPFYSFSFAQNPNWSCFHPPGSEILQYYHDVCARYKIVDKFQLNTDIEYCKWHDDEQLWEVKLVHLVPGVGDLSSKERLQLAREKGDSAVYQSVEIVKARIVLSAAGGLVEPRGWPEEIEGIENFKGKMFHSARWDGSVETADKDIVVVGTGCSSAQIVPALIEHPYNAKTVTQLVRSPPWVVPKSPPLGGDIWWEKNSAKLFKRAPFLMTLLRILIFHFTEATFHKLFPDTPYSMKQRKIYQDKMLASMKNIVPTKYHEILTPNYGIGCKRRIFDKNWFKSLNDSRIELTTQPLKSVTPTGVILGSGVEYPSGVPEEDYPQREVPADIIVLANGFDTNRWLHPLQIIGRDGQDLTQVMDDRGGPQAYQGTAMDGFPNFFMIFGPNTATGHSSVVLATENMVNYSLNFIKPILNGEVATVEVKKDAETAYTDQIQTALKDTVWKSGCSSWYFTKGDWNSTVYPYSQTDFWKRCAFPKWTDWNIVYTKRGIAKHQRQRIIQTTTVGILMAGAWIWAKTGFSLGHFKVAALQSWR